VYRILWRNLIIFLHNIVILVLVLAWYGKNPGWVALLSLPALVLLLLNGAWVGLLLGLLSARFRDIPQIVASIVQVMFFLTPIMWKPDMLPERQFILDINPFYYALTIVREPLLGVAPSGQQWLVILAITIAGWAVAMLLYTVYRWRLAYWL
jgi:ABC-2 type transport system permease protein/lipopolysaccharide transport system permease protein